MHLMQDFKICKLKTVHIIYSRQITVIAGDFNNPLIVISTGRQKEYGRFTFNSNYKVLYETIIKYIVLFTCIWNFHDRYTVHQKKSFNTFLKD